MLDVRLSGSVEASTDDEDTDDKKERLRRRLLSRLVTLPGSFTSGGLTYEFLTFPGLSCPSNKILEILQVAISGVDPFTTLAGQVAAFVGTQVPQASNTEPTGYDRMIGVPNTIPNVLELGRRSTILQTSQLVYLAFKGLLNGQQLMADISYIEHDRETFLIRTES